ncbi:hypothetical protein [Amycolatopsis speibonae]|uniref:Uncharacterized protein n=1 Tax=Amycolatopsis speibonae TaxID=1450224 RepID=A0ABV7P9K9_9PSEU
MRKLFSPIAVACAIGASVFALAAPASAASTPDLRTQADYVRFCHTFARHCTDILDLAPAGRCRNLPPKNPWDYVHNYTNQGQIIFSGPNCTTIHGQNPVVLSPTIGRSAAYGEFRSYKHT